MRAWLMVTLGIAVSSAIFLTFFYFYPFPRFFSSPLSSDPPLATQSSSSSEEKTWNKDVPAPQASPLASQAGRMTDFSTNANGLSHITVLIQTHLGLIKFKFYPQDAPKTVRRVAELIQQGFYDGLTFHRVVPGFVIQGGDPVGNGTGGSGQKLEAEFNTRHHVEGTVAMARAQDPDSADSQFYISLGTLPHLDQQYTVFGQVVEGMDIVKKIKQGDRMIRVTIQP